MYSNFQLLQDKVQAGCFQEQHRAIKYVLGVLSVLPSCCLGLPEHCLGPGILLSFGCAILMQKCGHILQLVLLCWSHSFLSCITWCKLPLMPGMLTLNRSLKWNSRKIDQHLWWWWWWFLLWGFTLKTVTIELFLPASSGAGHSGHKWKSLTRPSALFPHPWSYLHFC